MPFMAERELECFLCRRHFTAMCGDLIIPPAIICPDCHSELSPLPDEELAVRLTAILAARGVTDPDTIAFVTRELRRPPSPLQFP